MNLRDELMAKCSTNGISKSSKKKKLNVITIQNGCARRPKEPKSRYCSSGSTSFNLRGRNTATDVTETFGSIDDTNDSDCKVILAITQGRGDATCEVGIAAINIMRPSLIMCQISDTLSYTNILTKMNILNPSEILIPLTTTSSRLTEKIKEYFKNAKIMGVPRGTFNSNNGFSYVKRVCAFNWNSIVLMVQYKYYALTAVSALLSYIENHLYTFYPPESMKVEYEESEGFTIIDVLTADKLELVACALPDINPKYSSLRGILNNCVTKIGARTLRATILQPPSNLNEINARLDCVEEFIKDQKKLSSLREILTQLSKIDQLLSLATIMPDKASSCSVRQLNYILLLNTLFDLLRPLNDIFAESSHVFLVELRETLTHDDFNYLKNIVRTIIHENARPAAGEQGMTERCFAIKPDVNPILDIIRRRYSERLDELREYVRKLGQEHGLDLKLSNNSKKGYHIVLKLTKQEIKSFKLSSLPDVFIHVERTVTMVTMTTIEIQTFQIRLEDISTEIVKISNVILYKLLVEIQKHIGLFYKLCEQIAKVDMLQSLALSSSSIDKYVRPKFNCFTEVINGRHPLLEYLSDTDPIGNDIFVSPEFNMNIVTGPNSSGKSIYIRQIALLQIMAQIGCFVPASSATFRVADRILARIYLEDDMYCGASTFTLEMKEIKYFFNVMTPNTLIIIDELCRSTSVLEGTGLAMAICEKLLKTPAFIFFTTHYTFITRLYDMYYNVQCWQLQTENPEQKIVYTYKIVPGVTQLEDYAIHSARSCWPNDVMKDVEAVKKYIEVKHLNASVFCIEPKMRLKYNIEADLRVLKYKGMCNIETVRERMIMYQRDLNTIGVQIDWENNLETIRSTESELKHLDLSFQKIIQPDVVYSCSESSRVDQNDAHEFVRPEFTICKSEMLNGLQPNSFIGTEDINEGFFIGDTGEEMNADTENQNAFHGHNSRYAMGDNLVDEYCNQGIVTERNIQHNVSQYEHYAGENSPLYQYSEPEFTTRQCISGNNGMHEYPSRYTENPRSLPDLHSIRTANDINTREYQPPNGHYYNNAESPHVIQRLSEQTVDNSRKQYIGETGPIPKHFTPEIIVRAYHEYSTDDDDTNFPIVTRKLNAGFNGPQLVEYANSSHHDDDGGLENANNTGNFLQHTENTYNTKTRSFSENDLLLQHQEKSYQQFVSNQRPDICINEKVENTHSIKMNQQQQQTSKRNVIQNHVKLSNDNKHAKEKMDLYCGDRYFELTESSQDFQDVNETFEESDHYESLQGNANKIEEIQSYVDDSSFATVNEFQFAMPLRRNVDKTSTPLLRSGKNNRDVSPGGKLLERKFREKRNNSNKSSSVCEEIIEPNQSIIEAELTVGNSQDSRSEDEFKEKSKKRKCIEESEWNVSISYSPDYELMKRYRDTQKAIVGFEVIMEGESGPIESEQCLKNISPKQFVPTPSQPKQLKRQAEESKSVSQSKSFVEPLKAQRNLKTARGLNATLSKYEDYKRSKPQLAESRSMSLCNLVNFSKSEKSTSMFNNVNGNSTTPSIPNVSSNIASTVSVSKTSKRSSDVITGSSGKYSVSSEKQSEIANVRSHKSENVASSTSISENVDLSASRSGHFTCTDVEGNKFTSEEKSKLSNIEKVRSFMENSKSFDLNTTNSRYHTASEMNFNLSIANESGGLFENCSKPLMAKKPINKMTKREIEQLYHERDLKYLNSTGDQCFKYSEEILNRPRAKQLKASKQVAIARKSNDGSVVVMCDETSLKRRTRARAVQPLKHNLGRKFDVTIFSDENARVFDAFMQTEEDPKRDSVFFDKCFQKECEISASSFVGANMDGDFFTQKKPVFPFTESSSIDEIVKKYS